MHHLRMGPLLEVVLVGLTTLMRSGSLLSLVVMLACTWSVSRCSLCQ
jgi:hypothetical protein